MGIKVSLAQVSGDEKRNLAKHEREKNTNK
jgi:hypothetical protein